MSFGEKILKYREDIKRDLAALVAIPSVRGVAEPGMPFGKESARALGCILDMAREMGLTVKNVDNYAGHAEYGEGAETAAVLAHVDVVPVGDGWDSGPFALAERNGCWYGRGVADDKGEAVVALYCLKVLMEEQIPAKRRLRVVFGAGEETGSEDLEVYYSREPLPVMGFTPDAEYGICNREKGILRLDISGAVGPAVQSFKAGTVVNAVPDHAEAELCCSCEQVAALEKAAQTMAGRFTVQATAGGAHVVSKGEASHAMQPQEGFNAASHLICLLNAVFSPEELGALPLFAAEFIRTEFDGASMGVLCMDEESGPLTLNLGLVSMENGKGALGIDIRYPVTADGDKITASIRAKAEAVNLAFTVTGANKPLFLPAESPFISLLQGAYQEVTGEACGLYSTGGGTYARSLQSRGVAFGPIFPDEPDRRLHNSNEHVEVERFMVHAQICLEAMYRMLTTDIVP